MIRHASTRGMVIYPEHPSFRFIRLLRWRRAFHYSRGRQKTSCTRRSLVTRTLSRPVLLFPFSLISPHPPLVTRIHSPQLIHPTIPQPQPGCHGCNEEATRGTHKVPSWITLPGLVSLPDPLRDDLSDARARVMQCDRERDGQQAGRVACDPVGHGGRDGEGAASREAEAAVAARVCGGREHARRQPAHGANGRGERDVPAAGVEVVRRIGQGDGDHEADAPRRDGHELGLDGGVA